MNDFDSILSRLSLHLDGQLPLDERKRLDADMAAHPEAAPMSAAFRQVDGMLRHAPHVAPLHDLSVLIMARIEQEKRTPRSLIGAIFVVVGTLSVWPILIMGTALFLGVSTLMRPETWRFVVDLLVSGLNTLYAMTVTWSTVSDVFGPWVLPMTAAALGVAILTLTLSWAKRANVGYHTADQRFDG